MRNHVRWVLGRREKVFADRFHTRALTSLREVRIAIGYVFQNARKHFQQKGVALRASSQPAPADIA